MKINEAISLLEYHQKWRRGDEQIMVDPKQLGEAIDMVLERFNKSQEALKALKDHYVELIDSGDCGNWEPREEIVIVKANEALSN